MTHASSLIGCLLIICLALSGCVEVTFPEPMPAKKRALTQFPQAWQGTWVSGSPNEGEETLVVMADRILGNPGSEDLVLGEDCVLKKLGRRLVLSIPQEKGGRYTLLVAKRHGNALNIQTLDPKEQGALDSWEEVLGHENVVKLHKNDDPTDKLREVQLNPKNSWQFRQLLRKGKVASVTYTKVNE